jgi:hypothetical protein
LTDGAIRIESTVMRIMTRIHDAGHAALLASRLPISEQTQPESLKVFLSGTPHNHRSPPGDAALVFV